MKPPQFEYYAPTTITEVVKLLVTYGEEARILAGGQTLVAAMNFRLARPNHLIDINGVSELDYIREEDGMLRIGALARHAAFEKPVASGFLAALLPKIAHHIAHLPIRTRGTFCGSIANADPASEWCLLAITLDAQIVVRSVSGERTIPASQFIKTTLTTDLRPDEFIVEARFKILPGDVKGGFAEFSRRAGDFALAMTCTMIELKDGRIVDVAIGVGGAAEKPYRAPQAEEALRNMTAGPEAAQLAAQLASEEISPMEDIHGSVEYRRDLVKAMTRRALLAAFAS